MKKAETKTKAAPKAEPKAEVEKPHLKPQVFNYMELDLSRHFSPYMLGVIYAAAVHERFDCDETLKLVDEAIDAR